MGTRPRAIEAQGVAIFSEMLSADFHLQFGHELRADAFIKLKGGNGSIDKDSPGGWLAVQVKTTTKRSPEWGRKIKFLLRSGREALHNFALIGISLDETDPVFIHVVHRCHNYNGFSSRDPMWNVARADAASRLRELCGASSTPMHESPNSAFVYSEATLVECQAREDFKKIIQGSPINYDGAPAEFTAVDGLLSLCSVEPPIQYRVQEKTLAWRREKGKPLGLRVCLRRSSGKNYKPGDADYLLLHARDGDPATCAPTRLHGSCLIPWSELEKHGFLHKSDDEPGCGVLNLYPAGVPGVKTGRDGWAEAFYHTRNDLVTAIHDELISAGAQYWMNE